MEKNGLPPSAGKQAVELLPDDWEESETQATTQRTDSNLVMKSAEHELVDAFTKRE